jgi:hypothetical protein
VCCCCCGGVGVSVCVAVDQVGVQVLDKFPLADGSAAVEHLSGVLVEAGVDTGRLAAELRARDVVGSGMLDVMGLKASLASLNAGEARTPLLMTWVCS